MRLQTKKSDLDLVGETCAKALCSVYDGKEHFSAANDSHAGPKDSLQCAPCMMLN